MNKTLVIIPAYNEEENIQAVVGNLVNNFQDFDYLVINDGSTDNTAKILRKNEYQFLDLPINLGLAGGFQAGLKYAVDEGYQCAIQFDADGQHHPEYLQTLANATKDYDIVIGSRFATKKRPKSMRMLGNILISGLLKITCKITIKDPTSGMRAYNKRMIKELSYGPNKGPEPDTLAYLIKKKNASIKEIQVEMSDRTAGKSYITLWRSCEYMARIFSSITIFNHFR